MHTVWFWSPHIGGGRFHDPPSSIPATTKSQYNYMPASDIQYLNTHVLWTLNNNFTYLVIISVWTELSVKGNYSHPNRWKQSYCRSCPPHCQIPPHILHPLIPRHFHLWHLTIRPCSQTLYVSVIMTSNSFYFVELPTNSGQSVFFQVEAKFFYL